MAASNKKNLYVADEDLRWFDRAKELFPDQSLSKFIADCLKDRCVKKEAELQGMVEQKVLKGTHELNTDIFIGQESRFYGTLLSSMNDEIDNVQFKIYLTRKGKFLVSRDWINGQAQMYQFDIYETYEELTKANIPSHILDECSEYLNINSSIRTYELLDV